MWLLTVRPRVSLFGIIKGVTVFLTIGLCDTGFTHRVKILLKVFRAGLGLSNLWYTSTGCPYNQTSIRSIPDGVFCKGFCTVAICDWDCGSAVRPDYPFFGIIKGATVLFTVGCALHDSLTELRFYSKCFVLDWDCGFHLYY